MSKHKSNIAHQVKKTLSALVEQRVFNEEPLRTYGVQTIKEFDMVADQLAFEFEIDLKRQELYGGMRVEELIHLVESKLQAS